MSKMLQVHCEGKPCYKIFLEHNFSSFAMKIEDEKIKTDRKVCIVTDSEVAKLYLNEVEKISKTIFRQVITFTFSSGEASKNMDVVQKLYVELINNRFDRGDLLIALGGGVVGDLTGFTAATYLRGIDFIQMPTTLLSQVDSSIGGKTGVDFLQYKNMVGAFYMPKMVYMNMNTILSLPDVQFASGMGEVIKYGLIQDKAYYQWLKENQKGILARETSVLEEMVFTSCTIKKKVVEADPKEQGERALLNFGHTIGHAIEKMSDFKMFHGQCVAVGMCSGAYLSWKRGYLSEEDYLDICSVIRSFGLMDRVNGYDAEVVLLNTKSDKKMSAGKIRFILLEEIGDALITTDLSDEVLKDGILSVTDSKNPVGDDR